MGRSILGKLETVNQRPLHGKVLSLGNTTCDRLADFCLNHCPHPTPPCNGCCPEYKEEKKKTRKSATDFTAG